MRMPTFRPSSKATRISPHVGFSRTISAMIARRSFGSLGLPSRDFQRQNIRNAFRCHPIKVLGFTTTKASLQSNQRAQNRSDSLAESINRRGLTFRSRQKASCFLWKRFSAARAVLDLVSPTSNREEIVDHA